MHILWYYLGLSHSETVVWIVNTVGNVLLTQRSAGNGRMQTPHFSYEFPFLLTFLR